MFIIINSIVDDCGESDVVIEGKFGSKEDGVVGFKEYIMEWYGDILEDEGVFVNFEDCVFEYECDSRNYIVLKEVK